MDLTGFAGELNAEYNKNVAAYLKDTKKPVVVTGMAVVVPKEDIARIKAADTYYLVNSQDKKYTIVLYKSGKKANTIELQGNTVLGYVLGKFCWGVNDRRQWYIGEVVSDGKSCNGTTRAYIKEKEETNLLKL